MPLPFFLFLLAAGPALGPPPAETVGTAAAPPSLATSAPASGARPAPAPAAPRLTFGEGFLELHGLLQTWFVESLDDNASRTRGTEPYIDLGERRSTFRQRRAELRFAGDLNTRVAFLVMMDAARFLEYTPEGQPRLDSRRSVLQDAVLTFRLLPLGNLSFGQAKTPLSAEGLATSSRLLFAERAEVARNIGDQRDVGVWIHQRFARVAYHLGVYDGYLANNLDDDSKKDLAGRVEVTHASGALVALAFQRSLSRADRQVRTTGGIDARFERGAFVSHAEAYWSRRRDAAGRPATAAGAFVDAAVLIGPLRPALRFDVYDPAMEEFHRELLRVTVGIDLFVTAGADHKLTLNYERTEVRSRRDNDLLILAAQASF